MKYWHVEFDTFDGWFATDYKFETLDKCVEQVEWALEEADGGHADIYTEDGEFVKDVEV